MRIFFVISVLFLFSIPVARAEDTGKKTYTDKCLVCHGTKGNGKGPAAMALRPAPPDFTDSGFWDEKTDEALAGVIRKGKPGTPMGGYGEFTDEQLNDLISYLKTFKKE